MKTGRDNRPLMDRFLDGVEITDGCWLWQGTLAAGGYGKIRVFGKKQAAHRVAYELFVGPLSDEQHIHHVCENKACVNPEHLEPISPADHALHKIKTICPRGHQKVRSPNKRSPNQMACRTCQAEAKRRNRRWKKAAA